MILDASAARAGIVWLSIRLRSVTTMVGVMRVAVVAQRTMGWDQPELTPDPYPMLSLTRGSTTST